MIFVSMFIFQTGVEGKAATARTDAPEGETLNPKPQTPNPKTPKPQTPNPKPGSSADCCGAAQEEDRQGQLQTIMVCKLGFNQSYYALTNITDKDLSVW